MGDTTLLWIFFNLFVLVMLALDLGVFHRKAHEVRMREALIWTGVWFLLAMLFNLFILAYFDRAKAIEFFTGYIIEKSLSVDNIFVMIMIFSYFHVPKAFQHKVLFWGILGALVMRVIFIFAGVGLIQQFHWLIYVFGLFLMITGIRMLFSEEGRNDFEKNIFVRITRKIFPITDTFEEDRFFIRKAGKFWATPLFLVVMLIEGTDLIFAVDSIPAILAISDDPLIVYSSNVFAILGLRSLYFALAGIEKHFRYLKYGLSAILVFVGFKMFFADWLKIPIELSLVIIVAVLLVAMGASLVFGKKQTDGKD